MPGATSTPSVPLSFVIITFVGAGVVGAVILWLGLSGHLGGPIP